MKTQPIKYKDLEPILVGYVHYAIDQRIQALAKACDWWQMNLPALIAANKLTPDASKNIDRAKKMRDRAAGTNMIEEAETGLIQALRQYETAWPNTVPAAASIETYREQLKTALPQLQAQQQQDAAERTAVCDTLKGVYGGLIDFGWVDTQSEPFKFAADRKLATFGGTKMASLARAKQQGTLLDAVLEMAPNVILAAAYEPDGAGGYKSSGKAYATATKTVFNSLRGALGTLAIAPPKAAKPITPTRPPRVTQPATPSATPTTQPTATPQAGRVAGKWKAGSANAVMYRFLEARIGRAVTFAEARAYFAQQFPNVARSGPGNDPLADALYYIKQWGKMSGQYTLVVDKRADTIQMVQ